MADDTTGNATVNGDNQPKDNAPANAQNSPQDGPKQQTETTVPYARFKEVVDARKAAEDSLAEVVQELVATLPEDMRDLVPNLPPAEKIRWINTARQRGVFAQPVASETDSPGSRRPGAKPPQDLSGLNPVQMMSMGYGR